jgi:pleckstrin family protein A (phosphoinositide binding specific) protein 8
VNNLTECAYPTFFTIINHRFIDLKLTLNDEIPTDSFLNCCSDLLSLIDNFGSSAFIPVKIDVNGNIQKLRQKYEMDTNKYHTLQAIVDDELIQKVNYQKNSATDALMWLRRGFLFFQEFLLIFSNTFDNDMTAVVYKAYESSLKPYHSWVVKGIFALATRVLPTKEEFLRGIAVSGNDFLENKDSFVKQVRVDMRSTARSLSTVLENIREFYCKNNLDV